MADGRRLRGDETADGDISMETRHLMGEGSTETGELMGVFSMEMDQLMAAGSGLL